MPSTAFFSYFISVNPHNSPNEVGTIIVPHFTDKEIEAQRVWVICLKLLNSYISLLLIIPLWVAGMRHEFKMSDSKLWRTVLHSLPPPLRKVLLTWSLGLPSSLLPRLFSYKTVQGRGWPSPSIKQSFTHVNTSMADHRSVSTEKLVLKSDILEGQMGGRPCSSAQDTFLGADKWVSRSEHTIPCLVLTRWVSPEIWPALV